MATGVSGYIDFAATKGFTLRAYYSESYDVAANTSSVTITKLQLSSSQYYGTSYYLDGTISIAGKTAFTMDSHTGNHGVYIGQKDTFYNVSGTFGSVSGIAHSGDGTKTATFAPSVHGYTVEGGNGNNWYASTSRTVALTTIPRKSSMSVKNGTLGTAQTITVTKQASSFTHSITYTCGDTSGRVCTKSSSTSISWTPPLELASQKPQDTSVTLNFTIETFSGETSVGTSTAMAIYNIPDSIVPYVAYASSDPTGHADTFGAYVQGQSTLKLAITASGSHGATIKSYSTVFDGKSYSGATFTSDTILQTGTVTASITVTDSRNRTTKTTKSITVLPYNYPKLTSLTAFRSDADGKSSNNGDYITVKFSSIVTNLNDKNGAWYKLQYKKSTDSTYTTVTLDSFTGNMAVAAGKYTFSATESSYDILVLVGDKIKTITYAVAGPSKSHTWSMLKKNNKIVGMAFGKIAEHEGYFELGWPLKIAGGDSVVEEGTSGNWGYRLWDSGVAECWMTLEHSTALSTAWGALYSGSPTVRQYYPIAFKSRPTEVVSLMAESYQGFIYPEKDLYGVNTASQTACYNICRPSSITTSSKFYINFNVSGRWK